jgi:hypothetical protein
VPTSQLRWHASPHSVSSSSCGWTRLPTAETAHLDQRTARGRSPPGPIPIPPPKTYIRPPSGTVHWQGTPAYPIRRSTGYSAGRFVLRIAGMRAARLGAHHDRDRHSDSDEGDESGVDFRRARGETSSVFYCVRWHEASQMRDVRRSHVRWLQVTTYSCQWSGHFHFKAEDLAGH